MGQPDGERFADEARGLLQALIRNRCTNDGGLDGGGEERNAETLAEHLEGVSADLEVSRLAMRPGRDNLVCRLHRAPAGAPTLLLHCGLDVRPADPGDWTHEPFSGELVDGEVWGRGAKNQLARAATAAVALRHLAQQDDPPSVNLTVVGAADHEAFGAAGLAWLAEHHRDLLRADWAIAGTAGYPTPTIDGLGLPIHAAEKGAFSYRVTTHGQQAPTVYTDGQASRALAEVITRIDAYAPTPRVSVGLERFLDRSGYRPFVPVGEGTPDEIDRCCENLPDQLAELLVAATRAQLAVTSVHGGSDLRARPADLAAHVLVETLPEEDESDARRHVLSALGDLDVQVELLHSIPGSVAELDTPLWSALETASRHHYPDATLMPTISARPTGASIYRALGATTYGYGLHSRSFDVGSYLERDRGVDERIDLASLGLTVALWVGLADTAARA